MTRTLFLLAALAAASSAQAEMLLSSIDSHLPGRLTPNYLYLRWAHPHTNGLIQVPANAATVDIPQDLPLSVFTQQNNVLTNGQLDRLIQIEFEWWNEAQTFLPFEHDRGHYTSTPAITPLEGQVDLTGLDLHLSRASLVTTAVDGKEIWFTLSFYGDTGTIPEPSSFTIMVLVLAISVGPIRCRTGRRPSGRNSIPSPHC